MKSMPLLTKAFTSPWHAEAQPGGRRPRYACAWLRMQALTPSQRWVELERTTKVLITATGSELIRRVGALDDVDFDETCTRCHPFTLFR